MAPNWIMHEDTIVNLDRVSSIHYDNEEFKICFNFDNDNSDEFDFGTKEAYKDYMEILMMKVMSFSKRGMN